MADNLVTADQVSPEPIQWLCEKQLGKRVPKGMLTVIAGRQDQGKGLVCAHLAAVVSKHGMNVLYSAIEDSHKQITRPRLEAAGADLKRVTLFKRGFQLPEQLDELCQIVRLKKIALLVIDPFAGHIKGANRHSDKIRDVLNPLTDVIEETGTALVIVEHTLKRVSRNSYPLQSIGGSSSGLVAAIRAGYLFGQDPDDADRRILACVKMNIAEKPLAMEFETDYQDIFNIGEQPYLVAGDEFVFDPLRLVTSQPDAPTRVGRPPDKRAAACEWLVEYLLDKGGPTPAGLLMEDAKQAGIVTKTLRRAAQETEIVKDPPGGGPNCTWDLPQELKDLHADASAKPAAPDAAAQDVDSLLASILGGQEEDEDGGADD